MALLESGDFVEVFRTINIEIRVISAERDPAHPERPKINWFGSVGPFATMVGSVHVTPDDHIRWHFVSESRLFARLGTEKAHRNRGN